jgi:hypothetical protein
LDAYGGIRTNEAFGDELHGILIRLRREDPLQIARKGFGTGALGDKIPIDQDRDYVAAPGQEVHPRGVMRDLRRIADHQRNISLCI